ncbi:MAG TPA: phosphopentomutase [Bacteroidota bacterium]|nr:phosphopentomutase [Bacteroidota bacterium]
MKRNKLILIVLDGVGIGALPDAAAYGDSGTNTIANVARAVGGLTLPNLGKIGLGNIAAIQGVRPDPRAAGAFGKMAERSKGKDSTTGHWEIAGVITERPFPTYPKGFPASLLSTFQANTGCKGILGNKAASGTEIIKDLGDEHVRTGFPIVYTSGDSVFQIAAHEEVIPLGELYEICRKTRESVVIGEHEVGRVIARPFVGTSGKYTRTPNRKDFAVQPPGRTVLEVLLDAGVETRAVGKIDDLFSGKGLKEKVHTKSNKEGIEQIIGQAARMNSGFLMANLVDFDMLFGHRQDARGFASALEEFDRSLPGIQECLEPGDGLMITADHGNDPTDSSTDHSREYVPILWFSNDGPRNVNLGTRRSFADAGRTVADFFNVKNSLPGESFLDIVLPGKN